MVAVDWTQVMGLAMAMFFYGVYALLFSAFLLLLLRRNRISTLLRAAAFAGFILATLGLVSNYLVLASNVNRAELDIDLSTRAGSLTRWTTFLQIELSDFVLLWRAFVLNGRQRKAILVPSGLFLVSIVIGLIHWISWAIWFDPKLIVTSPFLEFSESGAGPSYVQGALGITYYVSTILMNIWTTGTISIKIYRCKNDLKAAFGRTVNTRVQYYEFLTNLIFESGVLLTIFQILCLVSSAYNDLVNEDSRLAPVLLGFAPIYIAIYPLSLILFAEVGKHITNVYATTFNLTEDENSQFGMDNLRIKTDRDAAGNPGSVSFYARHGELESGNGFGGPGSLSAALTSGTSVGRSTAAPTSPTTRKSGVFVDFQKGRPFGEDADVSPTSPTKARSEFVIGGEDWEREKEDQDALTPVSPVADEKGYRRSFPNNPPPSSRPES